jgi:hypothetical protein
MVLVWEVPFWPRASIRCLGWFQLRTGIKSIDKEITLTGILKYHTTLTCITWVGTGPGFTLMAAYLNTDLRRAEAPTSYTSRLRDSNARLNMLGNSTIQKTPTHPTDRV